MSRDCTFDAADIRSLAKSHISSFNPSRLLMANITSFDSTNITSKHEDTTEGGSIKNDQYEVDVATLIINSIACPFTVLLNVLVIMAVKRRRRLQTKSNILLACLAATDALTGLITQPAFILWKTFEITGALNYNPARVIHGSALRALSVCSCLHLMLVTAERLVAIKFTMNYLYIVSEEKIKVVVILCWVVSLVCEVLKFIKPAKNFSFFFIALIISSCIIFVTFSYVLLYIEGRRHRKLIKTQQIPQEEVEHFAKANKALKTTVYVVGALAVCFSPIALAFITFLLKRPDIFPPLWARTFSMLNSLLNPLIYCWRQKELRKFVFKPKTQQVVHPP